MRDFKLKANVEELDQENKVVVILPVLELTLKVDRT
jgi:hypothetical protein